MVLAISPTPSSKRTAGLQLPVRSCPHLWRVNIIRPVNSTSATARLNTAFSREHIVWRNHRRHRVCHRSQERECLVHSAFFPILIHSPRHSSQSMIRPSVESALQLAAHQLALNFSQSLSSSPNTTTVLSTTPQILVQPFYSTISNLRPFDVSEVLIRQ